jgi:hypothetical protein
LTTLWRWLSGAAAQGLVRHEGTGRPRDPFRYWLPERDEFMFPEDGTPEEMQAWNNRFMTDHFRRFEAANAAKQPKEAPVSAGWHL